MSLQSALKSVRLLFFISITACLVSASTLGIETPAGAEFARDVQPTLQRFCYDCHGDGEKKGEVAFDDPGLAGNLSEHRELWWKALKNLRAGLMPPQKKAQPTQSDKDKIEKWIKRRVFEIDAENPDPGRVTIRRLNRAEYRNTIRDLLGVDFETEKEFPADDTGHGFDNIGEVLTLPPMLLEKYLLAANRVVTTAVPSTSKAVSEHVISGEQFHGAKDTAGKGRPGRNHNEGPLSLSFYSPAAVSNIFRAEHAGKYRLGVDLMVNEKYVDNVFDYNRCRVVFKVDGKEARKQVFSWEGGKLYHYDLDRDWKAGDRQLEFDLEPLTPGEKQTRTLSLQIRAVTIRGPLEQEYWTQPTNYRRFFPRDVPENADARLAYARELLANFVTRAYRRPVDDQTQTRLLALAKGVFSQPGKSFEAGVQAGMVAVLASPRFLFREEGFEPPEPGAAYSLVDEYSLASRLSYFLWCSMPDEELFRLASEGKLRKNLSGQVSRMLADQRSEALVKNFTGQWLQGRDIENVPIESRAVLAREEPFDVELTRTRKRFRELNDRPDTSLSDPEKEELASIRKTLFSRFRSQPRADLNPELRRAMRQETESVFSYVLKQDRTLVELLDSDYTFLNERLAKHYGITNVVGDEMRRVVLPPESNRGGILTEGTVLAVTSNPTRTSPVKRGLFVLDNILGTPPPPPPPNIPPLEDAVRGVTNRAPSLRETLSAHRANPLCSSCHNRMDPLGLALENFNAMGQWRTTEFNEPIDASGTLLTGEEFKTVKDLKHILVENHSRDFCRTLTEKMLTFALGRGLDYTDVETVDRIVARLEKANGRPSALVMGVVESAPFQKTRGIGGPVTPSITKKVQDRAEMKKEL